MKKPNRFSPTQLKQNMPNSSYPPQRKAQYLAQYNETGSITTVRKNFVLGTKEMHHLAIQYLIECGTSNFEETWKIEMPLEDL